jgi:hypothetical protein
MFVRCFVEISSPFKDVDAALTKDGAEWLPGLASSVGEGGDRRMTDVGFGDELRIGRSVIVTVGLLARMQFKTLLPIFWRPAHAEALLPAMDAEIEVAPMGPARSQLAMTARYTPPFGLLGRVADRALLHRVAEATIKDFLDRVVGQVEERLAGLPPGEATRGAASAAPGAL